MTVARCGRLEVVQVRDRPGRPLEEGGRREEGGGRREEDVSSVPGHAGPDTALFIGRNI